MHVVSTGGEGPRKAAGTTSATKPAPRAVVVLPPVRRPARSNPSSLRHALVALAVLVMASCGHRNIRAPYAPGQAPAQALLLASTARQLEAIAVPEAKVVANRVMRGNLAFVAQAPARFRGSVQVSGNELVTLSFTEQGYALRYKLDAFPSGFYHGPPSACAIEALLGVALDGDDLTALVLGGAPVIAEPRTTLEQRWDAEGGFEALVVANDRFVEQLNFVPQGDAWRFVGGKLWRRGADGSRGPLLWTLAHEELERHGDVVLPARTRITAPAGRKSNTVVISYKTRDLAPAFAQGSGGGVDPTQGGATEGGHDTDGGDATAGGDDWGDDDGGWENEAPATPTETPAPSEPAATPAAPAATPASPAATAVPKLFTIDGAGLTDRGDLCR